MQACFFALSGVLPRDEAIQQIKGAIEKTYKSKGQAVIDKNFAAVDATLDHLHEVEIPRERRSERNMDAVVPEFAPDFVREVTAQMMRGHGDELPVSKLPADGTYPSGTTRWEKSNVSDIVPLWREDREYFPASHYACLAYMSKRPGEAWSAPRPLIVSAFSEYSVFYHRLTIDRRGRLFLSKDYWSTYWFYRNDQPGSRGHWRTLLMSPDDGETWKLSADGDLQGSAN